MARFLDRSLSSRTTRIVATFTPFRTIYIPPTSTMTIYGVDPVTSCMGLRNGSSHADTMWRSHGAYPTAWVIRSHIKSRRSPERTVSQRSNSAPGIARLAATTITAFTGTGTSFKSGRHFATWPGLVPGSFPPRANNTCSGLPGVATPTCVGY